MYSSPFISVYFLNLNKKDTLEYKKKHRPLKVKLLDETVKTMIVDDSMSVEQLVEIIGKKMNIKNYEEFSLQTENTQAGRVFLLFPLADSCYVNCYGAGEVWLHGLQSLQEQGVTEDQLVVLKKKFFVEDANISRDDPVQLHLVYVQSRDAITSGAHPSTYPSLE
jgi:talin